MNEPAVRTRAFGISPALENQIPSVLTNLGWWQRWPELAPHILKLSDFFNQNHGQTPWNIPELKAAYIAYFLPLNSARLGAVFEECRRLGFPIARDVVDLGSGPGTAQITWPFAQPSSWLNCETSLAATEVHERFLPERPQFSRVLPDLRGKLLISSYGLREWQEIPNAIYEADSLILVEPSLQETSRRLMDLRKKLIAKGFSIWGPCIHQDSCPLLIHSKRDWCHDRIHFVPPKWWEELSRNLPMRNDTLTFSYLLASQSKPAPSAVGKARVIGDTLYEKGKIRQAICRSTQREFFAWLTRYGEPTPIPHGELVEIPKDFELKGNELRLKR